MTPHHKLVKLAADLACCEPMAELYRISEDATRVIGSRRVRHAIYSAENQMKIMAMQLRTAADALAKEAAK